MNVVLDAKRVLVVSPHMDDAALSVGALLAELSLRGSDVHVLTLFAGAPSEGLSPVAARFHDLCALPRDASAVTLRRREDRDAIAVMGAQAHHEDFLDAVYRRGDHARWLCEHDRAMFDADLPPEPDLLGKLINRIDDVRSKLLPDVILTCAAVGGHVDHKATRSAVTSVAGSSGTKARLWEDLPYAAERGIHSLDRQDAFECANSREAWNRKWRAIARYQSQTRMLWPTGQDWRSLLHAHARSRGRGQSAELLWELDARFEHVSSGSAFPEDHHTAGRQRSLTGE